MNTRRDEPQGTGEQPSPKRVRRVGPTSRGTASYARKRAVAACQVCRSRRTKCDNKKPKCSFCERTGAECLMAPDDMSVFDPASLKILERLDEMQDQLQQAIKGSHPTSKKHEIPNPEAVDRGYRHIFPGKLDVILDWPVLKPYVNAIQHKRVHSQPSPLNTSSPGIVDLDVNTYTQLLDNFFSFVHIKNPVLDETETRRMVRRVFSEGVGWDEDSCLTLIICAIGAIARSFFQISMSTSDIRESLGPLLLLAAQKRLGIVIGNHGLVAAQCLFFFGVYKMHMLQPHDAWRMFLQALAACQRFNFLTESNNVAEPTSKSHAEECIYWSCWKSERELRWILKLPDFGELANDHPKLFPSLPEGICDGDQLTAWYFYLSEISLWRLSTRARRDIEIFESTDDAPFLDGLAGLCRELADKAADWSNSLAPAVSLDRWSDHEESEVLRFILRGHVTSYYEALWWPFIDAAVNRGDRSPQVLSCVSEGLMVHVQCLTINQPGFRYRHHGTWLLQQSCIRSALVLLAVSKCTALAEFLPKEWKQEVSKTVQMLREWSVDRTGMTHEGVIELLNSMMAEEIP